MGGRGGGDRRGSKGLGYGHLECMALYLPQPTPSISLFSVRHKVHPYKTETHRDSTKSCVQNASPKRSPSAASNRCIRPILQKNLNIYRKTNPIHSRPRPQKTPIVRAPRAPTLPTKTLLHKINIPHPLPLPHRPPHIIRQPSGPTNTNGHSADHALGLHADQRIDIGFARKHLDRGAGAVDLLCAAGPGDEQLDAQDVAAFVHGQDGRHPGADPLEVFGRADDPDEHDFARGDGAGRVAGDEVAHVRDLVRDADAAGEEHDGAVGVEGVQAAVGAFDQGGEGEEAGGGALGLFEEGVGEAGAPADDERHGGFLQGEHVLARDGEAFFRVEVFGSFAPGDGEGVRGPETDGG